MDFNTNFQVYSFEGDYKKKKEQSFRGASKKIQREELLQKASSERQSREESRRKVLSAVKIQSFIRGSLTRSKQKHYQRIAFDEKVNRVQNLQAPYNVDDLAELLKELAFFYSEEIDFQRLEWLSHIFLTKSGEIIQSVCKYPERWLIKLKRLLNLNLRHLVAVVQKSSPPIAVPLRLLEVFTEPSTYGSVNNKQQVEEYLKNIWVYLIEKGYFSQIVVIFEQRVPDTLEVTHNPPTQLAASIFELFLRPLRALTSSTMKNFVVKNLLEELFCNIPSPQILNFLLPALTKNPEALPSHVVLSALLGLDLPNEAYPVFKSTSGSLAIKPTLWLLYAVLALLSPQTASMSPLVILRYLNVLQLLVVSLPSLATTDLGDNSDDEDMHSFSKENEEGQCLQSAIMKEAVEYLNEPQFVSKIVLLVDIPETSQECIVPLCCICHSLLGYHTLAMHQYRLLYSLAFKPRFLKILWESITQASTLSVFGSPIPLLQVLSQGLTLTSKERQSFIPRLTIFCAMLKHLILTLDDVEFFQRDICDESSWSMEKNQALGSSTMPFSLNEIAAITIALRDICLGLIEFAYPDSRPSINEQYRDAMRSFGDPGIDAAIAENPEEISGWLQLFKAAVALLRQLHSRDIRHHFCPENHWIAKHINIPVDKPHSLKLINQRGFFYPPFSTSRILSRKQLEEEGPPMSTTEIRQTTVLRELPFVMPFFDRVKLFQSLVNRDKTDHQGDMPNFLLGPQIQINIRRNYIYEDAFDKLSPENEPNLKLRMRIQLVNAVGLDEAGIDGGGIFREFLSELLVTAFDPNRGFFKATHDRLLYPNPTVSMLVEDFPRHYYFIGRMLGKAIYENMLVELPFADFFLSKLLARQSSSIVDIHHLASLDPIMYRNLLYLKRYDGDLSELGLDFTVMNSEFGESQVVELKPDGANIPVTIHNRIEYIHLIADYRLNKQIRDQCDAFKRGLADVINLEWLRLFDHKELQVLISGAHVPVNLDDLKKHTNYSGGYCPDHPVIKNFWDVAEEFTETQRRKFLKFVTSCSRPPLLGFKELVPAFCIQNAGSEPERLPTASTCMNLLKLPEFGDRGTLQEKLLYAIESGTGFELS